MDAEPGALLAALETDVRRLVREAAEARALARESERQRTEDTRALLLAVIEASDAFDRVFAAVQQREDKVTPQMKVWLGNFRTVRRLLDRLLSERGVTRIAPAADGFDPRWHAAVETTEDPGRPDGTIADELQPGYAWLGEALRKTQVRVVRNGA